MLLQMHFWNASSANPTDVLSHCVAESEIPPPRLHIEFTSAPRIHPQKNHIYPLKPLYSKQIRLWQNIYHSYQGIAFST